MQTVNFQGLAQASAVEIAWPLVDENNVQFDTIDAAKLRIETKPALELIIGTGLSYVGGAVIADLNNARSENLTGNLNYELWIQVGPDKLAAVRGTMFFTATKARI